ncbi:ATP-dependent nuclease [Mycolicibacterium fluoranthenivorans]|uniref:AAA domain-containing protein n=1 Tax=Mycolicibacterium fluoranthenivorans TaxID=258505 RepID=A0A1G4WKY4_9MYCO|nr:AAA family ATPase [Mycolicibacterium fluoranthenivorans]SCX24888.1 AAA domain-containing protein [Mycolicibacterium fluoranthenivorans]
MSAPTEAKLTSAWNTARHEGQGWPLFLTAIQIDGLRGWRGESVEFRYPVVAIAGANGAGKSTVLKAAASAYRAPAGSTALTYYPDDFFPKTPWDEVSGVNLTFTLRQGATTVTMTVRKPTHRWRGATERKARATYFLDISRIQPANTQIGYGRTAQEVISRGTTESLTAQQVSQLSRSLGRTYETARVDRSKDKQIGVVTQAGVAYSNFHQGAGEDSVLDMISLLGTVPDKSLVVIDEVEASLHPMAQRGLMTELLRLAVDKKLQIILSTHSPYILDQLPPLARVFISVDRDGGRKILYGVSTDFALNQMDDERHEELDIYCEDDEAAYAIERVIATGAPSLLSRVRITGVGPASTVMALATITDKLPRPGICVVDGEQTPGSDYLLLPGNDRPEVAAFQSLSDAQWEKVALRLGRPAGELLDAKEAAMNIENHHAWTREIAKRLGGTMRPSKVWEAVADIWITDVLGTTGAQSWCAPIEAALRAANPGGG